MKNNLQVIASLLHFQAKRLRSSEDAAALGELRTRIYAMTLVHERLYQARDIARVDFGDYVRALVAELTRSFGPRSGVRIDVESGDVALPVERALPAGMLVCELVTNVLKYAFPGGRAGVGTVRVREDGERVLVDVDDDGVGFPETFDPSAADSFGWALIRTLAVQLDGTVHTEPGPGAHVRVAFPLPALSAEVRP